MWFNKPLLAIVFDSMFDLTEEGWRKLTLRWAMFFLALAVLNEVVWRTQTTDFWVNFKVFGVVPLTFIFARSVPAPGETRAAKTSERYCVLPVSGVHRVRARQGAPTK